MIEDHDLRLLRQASRHSHVLRWRDWAILAVVLVAAYGVTLGVIRCAHLVAEVLE